MCALHMYASSCTTLIPAARNDWCFSTQINVIGLTVVFDMYRPRPSYFWRTSASNLHLTARVGSAGTHLGYFYIVLLYMRWTDPRYFRESSSKSTYTCSCTCLRIT